MLRHPCLDNFAQVAHAKYKLTDIESPEVLQQVPQERLPGHRRHAFGDLADNAAEPCSEAAGEDDYLHT